MFFNKDKKTEHIMPVAFQKDEKANQTANFIMKGLAIAGGIFVAAFQLFKGLEEADKFYGDYKNRQ